MRDLANDLHLKPAFAPKAAVTDNTAQVSTACDLKGFGSCMLAFVTGTLSDADATFTVLIEDSDDDSTYVAVDDVYLTGINTGAYGGTEDASPPEDIAGFNFADDGECRKIGYTGIKQYVRATITPANNTGNLFVAGMWVLGHPSRKPTANPPA